MNDQQASDQQNDDSPVKNPDAPVDEALCAEVMDDAVSVDAPEEENPLQDELIALKDKLLRNQAEMENLRRRTQKEVLDARKFAVERFATALLDVVDNLERALDVKEGNEQGVRDGIQLTLDSWHDVMEKFNIKRVEAMGEAFNPHQHEALSKMPADADEGIIIAQHCAGYTLNGRLIRPAKVLVSSGPAT
ncbi:MAG: nucleotide exchange factor GrpE [Mariprofundaceae bacterium]|nr:nucleotide exchange factor GrpE [Mariprofundaceae bacterium]